MDDTSPITTLPYRPVPEDPQWLGAIRVAATFSIVFSYLTLLQSGAGVLSDWPQLSMDGTLGRFMDRVAYISAAVLIVAAIGCLSLRTGARSWLMISIAALAIGHAIAAAS